MGKREDIVFERLLNLYIKPRQVLIPRKSLGQHKLVKKDFLEKIGSFAHKDDIVVEIGGGEGNLTKILEKNSKLVISFEVDDRMYEHLKKIIQFGVVVKKDFLQTRLDEIYKIYENNNNDTVSIKGDREKIIKILDQREKIKIVSNIPFYISSQLIHKIVLEVFDIKSVHLLVQYEFAKKISSKEGVENYSAISCITRFFFEPKIEFVIPNFFFRPVPEVNGAFISLLPKENHIKLFYQDEKEQEQKMILKFVDFCYQTFRRRKKLMSGKRVYQLSPDEVFEEFKKNLKSI
jgi:16S rRNA (adenine1518-N6/adenine1519-N6)-dimethyltransferase